MGGDMEQRGRARDENPARESAAMFIPRIGPGVDLQLDSHRTLRANAVMPDVEGGAAPHDCSLIPVFPGDISAAIRICAVVQKSAGGTGRATLVLLGSSGVGRA